MRLEVQRVPLPRVTGAAVLHLTGVIDTTTLNEFEQRLQETTGDGFDRLLLDLERVRYINSSGFGAMVKYSDQFKARGGGLALIQVPAKVQVVLEMLGLQAFFPIYQTQAEAEEALAGAGFAPNEPVAPAAPRVATRAPRPAAPAPAAPVAPAPAARVSSGPAPRLDYPFVVSCATCSAGLEVAASGAYRCPGCGSVFQASPEGYVSFPETGSDSTAIHLALDTSPAGRGVFAAAVASLGAGLLGGRSKATLSDAIDEICDWMQSGGGGAAVRFNVLLLGSPDRLRVDVAESGPARQTAGLTRAGALFSTIESARVSDGRNRTRLVLERLGAVAAAPDLVEARS